MSDQAPVEYIEVNEFTIERAGDTVVVELKVGEDRVIAYATTAATAREIAKVLNRVVCRTASDSCSDDNIAYAIKKEEGQT